MAATLNPGNKMYAPEKRKMNIVAASKIKTGSCFTFGIASSSISETCFNFFVDSKIFFLGGSGFASI